MRMTAKRRAAEAAVASAELAPDPVSMRRRRRQLEATIRTGETNAAEFDAAGKPYAAARLRANLERFRTELAGVRRV
jgi:hypothetical protein